MNAPSIKAASSQEKNLIFLLLSGVIGLVASFILTLDKIRLLEQPSFVPACSLNPVITCSAAMSSVQATTFGIPNSMIGIVMFTALIASSGLILIGTTYSKRTLAIMYFVAAGGFIFTNYLILQSVLVLHVICPWCFTVWITSPLILYSVYRLYRNTSVVRSAHISARLLPFFDKYAKTLLFGWYVLLFILLVIVFRDYLVTLIS